LVVAGFRHKGAQSIANVVYLNVERSGLFAPVLISHGRLGTVEMIERKRVKGAVENTADARKHLDADKVKQDNLYQKWRTFAREELERLTTDHEQI
jgi:hypothetical protein